MNKPKHWKPWEDEILRDEYPIHGAKAMAKLFGVTEQQVRRRTCVLRIKLDPYVRSRLQSEAHRAELDCFDSPEAYREAMTKKIAAGRLRYPVRAEFERIHSDIEKLALCKPWGSRIHDVHHERYL